MHLLHLLCFESVHLILFVLPVPVSMHFPASQSVISHWQLPAVRKAWKNLRLPLKPKVYLWKHPVSPVLLSFLHQKFSLTARIPFPLFHILFSQYPVFLLYEVLHDYFLKSANDFLHYPLHQNRHLHKNYTCLHHLRLLQLLYNNPL